MFMWQALENSRPPQGALPRTPARETRSQAPFKLHRPARDNRFLTMSEERSLFNPPPDKSRMNRSTNRSTSSTRSIRSTASGSSSKSSKRQRVWSLLGRRRNESRADSPTLKFPRFPSMGSIASGDSTSTTSSGKSTRSSISTVSKRSTKSSRSTLPDLTDLDLFGVRVPPTEEELAPTAPNGVELGGRAYKVPEPIDKGFYRDLTMLEDEELIRKYDLIQVNEKEQAANEAKQSRPEITKSRTWTPTWTP